MSTVLLAYERDQDLGAIETLLESRGHRVVKSRTGLEALELARHDPPQAVVSDVLLPLLDGFALCRRLKEDPLVHHLPVFLLSFRVEGPKYEAFAAEVGAARFFPRGSTLEDLAAAIDSLKVGSGTMRMPALVPELLERREQDRKRVTELERRVRDLESANQLLAVAERVARKKAETEARQRSEQATGEAERIRELTEKVAELESRQQTLSAAESAARGAAEQSKAEAARIGTLESRLAELKDASARAEANATDAERVFRSLPLPTLLSDMETQQLRAISDAGAALFGIAPEKLLGRKIPDLLPGYSPGDDPARPVDLAFARPDGTPALLELRRASVSSDGRACWLTTARDVTVERGERATQLAMAARARALHGAPFGACLVNGAGEIKYANAAFHTLMGLEVGTAEGMKLQQFEQRSAGDSTIRSLAIGGSGQMLQETQWRRPDGSVFDVELASASLEGDDGPRVISVRDVSSRRRAQERAEREQRRSAGLLDLAQTAHGFTEAETLARALELLEQVTASERGYVFLATADAGHLELSARQDGAAAELDQSPLTRWRGVPPQDTALFECLSSQRPTARDEAEGTGNLRHAGLPGSLRRQLATPMLDGGRVAGVLLLADKKVGFDDDDRRHAAAVADAVWKVLRRRRSDAEVVSAMDHMERVMLGTVEAIGGLAEAQDACKTGRAGRVGELAAGIGAAMGLPGHTVRGLRVIGQLVDVGMLQIPREILWRPGQLAAAEFELVKTHPERGFETLRRIEFPWPVAEAVRQHHERLDGSGYPRALKGDAIILEARIVAVADAVEAMLSPRPNRAALALPACIEELQSQAGRRYDARVIKACVKLLRERPSQPELEVSAGQRIA
jgi:PAS domain S-box-containing protein